MTQRETMNLGRRVFLKQGTLLLTAGAAHLCMESAQFAQAKDAAPLLRVGMITDLHYADKPPTGTRHYRETLAKLAEAAQTFEREKPRFIVELGDLIDAADSVKTEMSYLTRINKEFAVIHKDRHYVLGNHCVDTLTKQEFLEAVEQKASHYSFDREGVHFVILDACFNSEGKDYGRRNFKWTDTNIPVSQVEWLEADLRKTEHKVIIFAHQRLDVANNHGVKNGAAVRKVLEASGKVLAVFQGHSHKNDYNDLGGIHYCTLAAMIEGSGEENNSYTLMAIHPTGTIELTGHRQQKNYEWER